MAQVVDQVVDEIARRGLSQVLLWGHSSGAAFAMATAAKLQQREVDVQRVFLGAQLPGDAAGRCAAIAGLTGRSDAEIAAGLSADDGYAELGELDAQHAGQIGAAYRHDCVSAHRYLADALDNPRAVKLSAPVTVVLAADDSHTAGLHGRHRHWQLLADHVDLHGSPTAATISRAPVRLGRRGPCGTQSWSPPLGWLHSSNRKEN